MLIHRVLLPRNIGNLGILVMDYSTRVTSTMGTTEQMNISRSSNRDSMHNKGTMSRTAQSRDDRRVAVYDKQGNVNLNAGLETNIPKPSKALSPNSPKHHNTTTGSSSAKILSNSIRKTHQNKNFSTFSPNHGKPCYLACYNNFILNSLPGRIINGGGMTRLMSSSEQGSKGEVKVTQKDRLKKAVKEYGATVIIFHVTISLISLGSFYLAVSSGLDMAKLLSYLGFSEEFLKSSIATGASTFAVAYAVHKVFAPARIAITLTAVPLIVRHLRKIGILSNRVHHK